ncbi:MAG: hypothetical protein AB7U73_01990 [Pirellulales bacterium]
MRDFLLCLACVWTCVLTIIVVAAIITAPICTCDRASLADDIHRAQATADKSDDKATNALIAATRPACPCSQKCKGGKCCADKCSGAPEPPCGTLGCKCAHCLGERCRCVPPLPPDIAGPAAYSDPAEPLPGPEPEQIKTPPPAQPAAGNCPHRQPPNRRGRR